MSGTVSVIMAAYNASDTIEDSIRSALDQTYGDVEVVVIDDRSTDGTYELVKGLGDPRIKVHRQAVNGGPGPARNRALDMCTGRWITFLDADDLYHPERLARLVAIAEEHGDGHVYGDDIHWWKPHLPRKIRQLEPARIFDTVDVAEFVNVGRSIHCFFARSLWEKTRAQQPALLAGEDMAFIMRMAWPTGAKIHYVTGKTYIYRVVEGTLTGAIEQPSRVLTMVAMLRDEMRNDPRMVEAFEEHERKLVPEAYYRRLRGYLEQQHYRRALRHAASNPLLLAGAPVRMARSRLKMWGRKLGAV